MPDVIQVFRVCDRSILREVVADDAATLEAKLAASVTLLHDRAAWPKLHERCAILRRAATLLEGHLEFFAKLIAQEGGKPYPDAMVEAIRAVDGLRDAAEELQNLAGREIPMGLTAASDNRWAFTTKKPIGIVAAVSAFNHPLNLIVHQVAPAVAIGCPVIIKPAITTPLCCLELVRCCGRLDCRNRGVRSSSPPITAWLRAWPPTRASHS